MFSIEPWQLLLAVAIDLAFGDPRKLPHVTRFTGTVIQHWEAKFRRQGMTSIVSGILFYLIVNLSVLVPFVILYALTNLISTSAAQILACIVIFQAIAFRDLIQHAFAILKPLRQGNLKRARYRVSYIVGRDTDHLTEHGVCRAAIEAVAESYNDGIIAPLFWSLVLGPFGALWYRITNTLDSMVGHRDHRYERFGKASARTDDVLGYLPARLSAFFLWLVKPRKKLIRLIAKDAKKHGSPNAGWPEATIAHCQDLRLGGTNSYDNEIHQGPVFNRNGYACTPFALKNCIKLTCKSYLIAVASLAVALWIF